MIINEKQEEIARKILIYLQNHSEAGDTVQGITKWWLEFEKIDTSINEVEKAVNLLIRKGLLRKVKSGDNYVYSLNK